MYFYKIYGLNVESDYRLDAALPVDAFDETERDVWIHEGGVSDAVATERPDETQIGKGYFYRYEQQHGWVRAVGQGAFLMLNGNEIAYRLKPGHDPQVVAGMILCIGFSALLVQRGRLTMHGSAVSWQSRVLVISGHSGAGKSTLTSALLHDGGVFMADDAVAMSLEEDVVYAHPTFPQLKLCVDRVQAEGLDTDKLIRLPDDMEQQKYALLFDRDSFVYEKKALHALVVIQVGDVQQGYLEKVNGSGKLKIMIENLYGHENYRLAGMKPEVFRECVKIADKLNIYRLVRPAAGMDLAEEVALLRNGVL